MRQEIVDKAVGMFVSVKNKLRSEEEINRIREMSRVGTKLIRKIRPELTKEETIKHLLTFFNRDKNDKISDQQKKNIENLIGDLERMFGKLEEDEVSEITNQIQKLMFSDCMRDTLKGIEDAFKEEEI